MTDLYELRFYDVTPGRLNEEIERMRRVAVDDWGDGQSLFARFGIPRPLAVWQSVGGDRHPLFGYLMRWPSLDARDRAFPPFWACPEWAKVFNETNAGHPMVDGIEDWLLAPSGAWIAPPDDCPPLDGLHEMRIHRIAGGMAAPVADYLAEIEHPQIHVLGGALLGAFEIAIGPGIPAIVSMIAWPDLEALEAARRRLDVEPRVLQRFARWRLDYRDPLIRSVETYLLRPVDYGVPQPGFARYS
jgi:hypothetical protein